MKDINDLKLTMYKSPIRQKIIQKDEIPYKNEYSKKLNNLSDDINHLELSNKKELNIVIVGEVKSGKSTLFNTILNEDASEVDVLEATSSIVKVAFTDKVNLIDTPGLKSITEENENKTMNYIKNADLVLFVIDATHLGQEDVMEALGVIYDIQKLTVGVVTKCSSIPSERESIVNYINEEYSIFIDEFFILPSIITHLDDYKREVGNIKLYINHIEKNHMEIKSLNMQTSLDNIIHKEIILHSEYEKQVKEVIYELNKYEKLLINKSVTIEEKMKNEVSRWLEDEFLKYELKKARDNIIDVGMYINESSIQKVIDNKKMEFDMIFFESWNECLSEVGKEINEDIKKYIDNINYSSELLKNQNLSIVKNENNLNEMLATIGTGAMLGITSGGILSVYAATLSGSAASLSLGASLMMYCPPMLLAGTITGAIGKLIYDKIKDNNKLKEVESYLDTYIVDLKYCIKEEFSNIYDSLSHEIIYTTLDILRNIKNVNMIKDDLDVVNKDIENYICELKEFLK